METSQVKLKDRVLWAGRKHQVLDLDENLNMAKIGLLDAEHRIVAEDVWWVRLDVLKSMP